MSPSLETATAVAAAGANTSANIILQVEGQGTRLGKVPYTLQCTLHWRWMIQRNELQRVCTTPSLRPSLSLALRSRARQRGS